MKRNRVTLAEVAARAGVSPTAVSLVLNERPGVRLSADSVARIRAAAAELNYRPHHAARSLRLGTTSTVAFISDEVLITRFASELTRGILQVAGDRGLTVLMAEVGGHPEQIATALPAILDRRPDAVVFARMRARSLRMPRVPEDVPLVLLNCCSEQGHTSVLPAEREAGRAMASILVEAGHRRIALIGYDDQLAHNLRRSATIGLRLRGIFEVLDGAGIELVARADTDDWEPWQGHRATQRFLDDGVDFTGLVCLNDRLAFGAYQALQESGRRIPDDVSIVSFDDDNVATYVRPGITTARLPYEEMGREAMTMALDPSSVGEQRLVPMPVIVRESVRKLST